MNVLDWSRNDNLGVSLGNSVYLWSYKTGGVEKLHTYKNHNIPTALTFDLFSEIMAVGTLGGFTEIRDL
jgi:cell division cycle 20-like protein 1 (cofactor of APC complex)